MIYGVFNHFIFCLIQLTSTMLHVLILASSSDHEPVKDFIVKVSIVYMLTAPLFVRNIVFDYLGPNIVPGFLGMN